MNASNEPTTFQPVKTADDNRQAALALARMARRSLVIFTQDLEPSVFDQNEFLDALRSLVTGSSRVSVRILLVDSNRARREGNRLVALAQKLSSFIEIRKPHRDYLGMSEAFVVADEEGILYRKLGARWDGLMDLHDPLRAREKLKLFNDIWQRSAQEPEARRLGI